MLFRRVIVIAIVGSTRMAGAQSTIEADAERMSLAQLFGAAVRVAPQLQSAAFDVATARAARITAESIDDLDLTMSANRSLSWAPYVPVFDTGGFSATLARKLPTNGTLSLAAGTAYSPGTVLSAGGPLNSVTTSVNLSLQLVQPLLQNAGADVERATIRQTQHQLNAATIRRTAVARTYAAQVIAAYWTLALAWRQLDVHKLTAEATKKQLAAIQRGMKSGAIARSDALPFEQSLAASEIDIASSERDIIDQSIALRTLVGLEMPSDHVAIRPDELPKVVPRQLDLQGIVRRSVAASDDLRAALEDVRAAEAQWAASTRNLRPRLDLTLNGGPSGTAALPKFDPGAATSAMIRTPGYSAGATLTFELPFARNAVKGAYQNDRASVARTRFNLAADRRQIISDTTQLVYDARTDARIVELAQEEARIAQANLEAEQNKFENGHSTANEIVRRYIDLEAARVQVESATADYIVSLAKIEAATGEILPHYGIRMLDLEAVTESALGNK